MLLIENFLHLFVESAPYLLVGMALAGLIHQFVPRRFIERVLGKSSNVATAAVIGAPLPLCSCSVIPVAMGIRRSGASKASTASFLVATPETGVDSVGITYALMGPAMAIARPISAIFSAITAGLMVKLFGSEQESTPHTEPTRGSCCGSKVETDLQHSERSRPSFSENIRQAFVYGYGKLLRDFMKWLLIGIFFAALIQTFVPTGMLTKYGQGIVAMLIMVLISIPMYICATASTPIAVGLMLSGFSPGAALVFMLTGPATNIATLMVIKNELGTRELLLYLISVVASAVCAGYLLDYIFLRFDISPSLSVGDHGAMVGFLFYLSAVILAVLIMIQYVARLPLINRNNTSHGTT